MPIYYPPETSQDLFLYNENHLVRTGRLLYYDALLFSDLADISLATLNTLNETLPETDPTTHSVPRGGNARVLTIQLTTPPVVSQEMYILTDSPSFGDGFMLLEGI